MLDFGGVSSIHVFFFKPFLLTCTWWNDTVDGSNPAPPGMIWDVWNLKEAYKLKL